MFQHGFPARVLAVARTVAVGTNTGLPPSPSHSPPAPLLVAVAAPSIMRVPFGIVTGLSCLAWIITSERWLCRFQSAFSAICTLSRSCGSTRPLAHCFTQTAPRL